jgi:hypothetical protein
MLWHRYVKCCDVRILARCAMQDGLPQGGFLQWWAQGNALSVQCD